MKQISLYALLLLSVLMASCMSENNYTGIEFAPQMYHSVPYEPYTSFGEEEVPTAIWQINDNVIPVNDYGYNPDKKQRINMLTPPEGTVSRQTFYNPQLKDTAFFHSDIHKDSLSLAAQLLKTPFAEVNDGILKEGKELYNIYCSSCHGAEGKGNGKVAEIYKGVANLTGGAYKALPEGHVYHVITHGKGRMWAHKSLLTPEERWKVVHYVKNVIQK
ncbi:MAG: c-type cytochrome [Bernardetiaceae bacterium]